MSAQIASITPNGHASDRKPYRLASAQPQAKASVKPLPRPSRAYINIMKVSAATPKSVSNAGRYAGLTRRARRAAGSSSGQRGSSSSSASSDASSASSSIRAPPRRTRAAWSALEPSLSAVQQAHGLASGTLFASRATSISPASCLPPPCSRRRRAPANDANAMVITPENTTPA
jgi:hypothetical protein